MIPRVWAPRATRVTLVLPGGGRPGPGQGSGERDLHREQDGWWSLDLDLPHGSDYAFRLDGGDPLPDPRSAWLPHGVHGPSRVFDAGAFTWTDRGWSGIDARGAVTYELHVGTFTPQGTLDGAAQRLEHLVRLGVDLVELMPLAPYDGQHGWGYDGVAPYAVHEPYGGPAALQRFVDAAHAHGLGVCLDVVYNHLGPSGNYLAQFGPYFTDAHSTPWGDAVNLDGPDAGPVRRYVLDAALRWFDDFHLDALRLDAVHALADDSDRHLLAELADEVGQLGRRLGRPLSLVAETDLNDPSSVAPTDTGGWGMTAQWADDVHHALHALVTGERQGYYVDFGSPQTLRHALRHVFVHDGSYSTFRGRVWGARVPDDVPADRFVVCAQNHDQVGNRALGDRPSQRLDDGALAAQAAFVLLSGFTPMLFMGEEWGTRTPFLFFTDYPDPELGRAVREGRRAEFAGHGTQELYGAQVEVPDPQDRTTFTSSRLNWAEVQAEPRLLDWYRQLIALRRDVPDLAGTDRRATDLIWEPHVAEDGPFRGWLVLLRGEARVVVNLAEEPRDVPLPASSRAVTPLASWAGGTLGTGVAHLPARSVLVVG